MKFAAALSALLLAGLLAGCVTPGLRDTDLQEAHAISLMQTPTPEYDYTVSIMRISGIFYDTADRTTRDQVALRYLNAQCPDGSVAGEDVVDMGDGILGVHFATYFVHVKCN